MTTLANSVKLEIAAEFAEYLTFWKCGEEGLQATRREGDDGIVFTPEAQDIYNNYYDDAISVIDVMFQEGRGESLTPKEQLALIGAFAERFNNQGESNARNRHTMAGILDDALTMRKTGRTARH
jgi:hypothetical protein